MSLFIAPTASTDGRSIIGNLDQAVAAGTDVSDVVRAGAFLLVGLQLDQPDRINDLTVLRLGATLAEVCQATAFGTGTCCSAGTTGAGSIPDLGSLVQAGGPLAIPALLLGGMFLGAAFRPRRWRDHLGLPQPPVDERVRLSTPAPPEPPIDSGI